MSRSFVLQAVASAAVALAIATSTSSWTLAGSRDLAGAAAEVGAAPLNGVEIQARLVGNTINGVENGEAYSEYLAPNGTIRGLAPSGLYTGRWRINNNQICFHYDESDGEVGAWDCSPVTLVGEKLYWSDDGGDGAQPEATLVSGNPKNL